MNYKIFSMKYKKVFNLIREGDIMKRIVVELKGNLAFCGINKGNLEIEGEKGILVETETEYGLKVWCPDKMIENMHQINIDEEG